MPLRSHDVPGERVHRQFGSAPCPPGSHARRSSICRGTRPAYLALAAFLLLAGGSNARAQAPVIFDHAPIARWIAPPGIPGDSFAVFHARRTFELASVPAHFVVHVSADNRYRLFVNGTQVSSGPQRSDVDHWRYETIDIAPQLRPGRNVLAALVWNWGAARPVAQHSHRTGFLVQGNSAAEGALVNTGAGWRLLLDSAYAPIIISSASMGDYYAAPPGDSISGARYPWGWERPDYDDAAWPTDAPAATTGAQAPLSAFLGNGGGAVVGRAKRRAVPPGGSGEMSGWQLEPRSIPPMEEQLQRLAARQARDRRADRRRLPARRGRPRDPAALAGLAPPRPVAHDQRLRRRRDEPGYREPRATDLRRGARGLDGAQGKPRCNRGTHAARRARRHPPRWRRASAIPDALLALLPLHAARHRHRRRAASAARPARDLYGISLRRTRALRVGPPVARRHVAHGLERRAHRGVRDVHGHAILGATPVHRRHPHPVVDLALRRRRRSPHAAGDRALRPVAHSRGDHRESLPLGHPAGDSAVLAHPRGDGARLLHAPPRR